MQLVQPHTNHIVKLGTSFLEPYRRKGDPFVSLLARSTYLTKYCRDQETWTDTIRRVVEGNINLAPGVSLKEAEALFDVFWTGKCLPPGRSLWVGGVEGIPADARFNCWYVTLRQPEDWCWAANQLMLGGGVGFGLGEIEKLPVAAHGNVKLAVRCKPDHANAGEVKPDEKSFLNGSTPIFTVPDSREGWVAALRVTLTAAFSGRDQIIDVSEIRERGKPIRTFGGIACGPGPLTNLLRAAWAIIRGAQGRKLSSVECLDITNHVGKCIKSGNVRRSALIVIGNAYDRAFRDAKKDQAAVNSHRHTSNNSIMFRSEAEMADFNWSSLVDDVVEFGEPGILNMPLVWKTDPDAEGFNPCGEQALHNKEACNLVEAFPAKFDNYGDIPKALRLVTRYAMRQRLTELSDPISDAVARKNMRIGVALGGLCDFEATSSQVASWYAVTRAEANSYADELGVARPITTTTVKPSGTISLLNGSSPGIHAPFAPFYLRRTRIPMNDPMLPSLLDANVPHEYDVCDDTGNTLVLTFPMKAIHTRQTVQTQTLREQFENQKFAQQYWADNAVSATLSFNKDEKPELASLLREYVPFLKSTSLLPRAHGYAQAPYEACTQAEYEALASKIRHDHPLARGGDMDDGGECTSGVCPVR